MRTKGIGPQGLGLKGNNGYCIGSPAKFKGANSQNSKCWKGKKKVGTKPSPTRPGVTVNDCR